MMRRKNVHYKSKSKTTSAPMTASANILVQPTKRLAGLASTVDGALWRVLRTRQELKATLLEQRLERCALTRPRPEKACTMSVPYDVASCRISDRQYACKEHFANK
eukprot:865869-Pleurochrysis_carterae.AAC.2